MVCPIDTARSTDRLASSGRAGRWKKSGRGLELYRLDGKVFAVSPPARPHATRDRILDAAEARLLDLGPTGLVLDAVAADAQVSKGGLLYHFPTKQALIEGMTVRMLERFSKVQQSLADDDPDNSGRWTRAYLHSTVRPDGAPADDSGRLMAGLLAGIGGDTSRLKSIRDAFASWQERIEGDGIDPVQATLVRLAADGLWLSVLLGLPPLEKRQAKDVLRALENLTRG
jgi:AcrR family transcriptional regulator